MTVLTLDELSRGLRALSERPLRNATDLAEWESAAAELQQRLEAAPAAVVDSVPHFVWHYLADADVRMKSEGYRRDQAEELDAALKELSQGGSSPRVQPTPKAGAADRQR